MPAAAIIGAAVVGGAFSYLGSKEQASAAESAAQAQVAAGDRATQAQLEMYNQSRADLAPWRAAGERGLGSLEMEQERYKNAVLNPNKYLQSPGYGWLQQQGIDALNKGASASGALDSGARSKDLMAYGQGLAKQDYTGYLGRLESLMNRYAGTAQVGQTATNTTAQMGQQTAGNMGNIAIGQGNAIASGQINQANATTGLYNNLSNIGSNAANQYMLGNYLQNSGGSGGSNYPAEYGYGYGR